MGVVCEKSRAIERQMLPMFLSNYADRYQDTHNHQATNGGETT